VFLICYWESNKFRLSVWISEDSGAINLANSGMLTRGPVFQTLMEHLSNCKVSTVSIHDFWFVVIDLVVMCSNIKRLRDLVRKISIHTLLDFQFHLQCALALHLIML